MKLRQRLTWKVHASGTRARKKATCEEHTSDEQSRRANDWYIRYLGSRQKDPEYILICAPKSDDRLPTEQKLQNPQRIVVTIIFIEILEAGIVRTRTEQ